MVRFSIQAITLICFAALPAFADAPAAAKKTDDPLPKGAVARLGTTRFRLPNKASLVGVTPEGQAVLLSSNRTSQLSFMDLVTGRVTRQLSYANRVMAACSGDGKTIFCLPENGNAGIILDADTGKKRREIPINALMIEPGGHALDHAVQLSRDGRFLAIIGEWVDGKNWIIWLDCENGKKLHQLSVRADWVLNPSFSADGQTLAIADDAPAAGYGLRAWNTRSAKQEHVVTLYDSRPDYALLPDSKSLIARASPEQLRLLEFETRKEIRRFGKKGSPISCFVLSPDAKQLFAGGERETVLWDVDTGKLKWVMPSPHNPAKLLLSQDRRKLISWDGQNLSVVDSATGR